MLVHADEAALRYEEGPAVESEPMTEEELAELDERARREMAPITGYVVRCFRNGRSTWLAFNGAAHYFWTRTEENAHHFFSRLAADRQAIAMAPDAKTPVYVEAR